MPTGEDPAGQLLDAIIPSPFFPLCGDGPAFEMSSQTQEMQCKDMPTCKLRGFILGCFKRNTCNINDYIPVVPREAVAEVSRIGNL